MVKALADRLAEASAEYLHAQARKDWGYGEQEQLSLDDVIAEKFRGIRPAYGYPACPDHSEKFKLFSLLEAPKQGITLTEHAAMLPAASVSGLYFSHPQAKYFNVGRLGRDQIESVRPPQGRASRRCREVARPEPRLRPSRRPSSRPPERPRPRSAYSGTGTVTLECPRRLDPTFGAAAKLTAFRDGRRRIA